jgi:transcriptional regulator with GAF, ATPase, and Fis domain
VAARSAHELGRLVNPDVAYAGIVDLASFPPRRKAPFIAISCGAIPHHLLQSELFGYERGAFTGANQRKIGRVEAADGGTPLLDEIGDLPLESQANLLRFLQEGKIERLGGRESIPVDVRIISATHVDLEVAMRDGRRRAETRRRGAGPRVR